MSTTIDAAGRVVLPKPLREALGLTAGIRVQVSVHDGALVIRPIPAPMRMVLRGKGVAVEPDEALPVLSASDVRAILESGRAPEPGY